jgi:hypothetical protein
MPDSDQSHFEVATALYPEQHLYVVVGAEKRCWFNPIPHPGYSVESLYYVRRTIRDGRVSGPDSFVIHGLPRGAFMPFEDVQPDDDNTIHLWTITEVVWEGGWPSFEGALHVTERRGFFGITPRPMRTRKRPVH